MPCGAGAAAGATEAGAAAGAAGAAAAAAGAAVAAAGAAGAGKQSTVNFQSTSSQLPVNFPFSFFDENANFQILIRHELNPTFSKSG